MSNSRAKGLIVCNHHKAICLLFVQKSAQRLFQNRINRNLQDSVHLQLAEYTTVMTIALPRYWIWGSCS